MIAKVAAVTNHEKPRIHVSPGGARAFEVFKKEITAYVRELPRLLEEEEDGRYALIKGDTVISTWDTYRDALQAGYDKFGEEQICITRVDSRDVHRYAILMEQMRETQCHHQTSNRKGRRDC